MSWNFLFSISIMYCTFLTLPITLSINYAIIRHFLKTRTWHSLILVILPNLISNLIITVLVIPSLLNDLFDFLFDLEKVDIYYVPPNPQEYSIVLLFVIAIFYLLSIALEWPILMLGWVSLGQRDNGKRSFKTSALACVFSNTSKSTILVAFLILWNLLEL